MARFFSPRFIFRPTTIIIWLLRAETMNSRTGQLPTKTGLIWFSGKQRVNMQKPLSCSQTANPYNVKTASRDGFSEIRQKLNTLLSHYSGRVLIIHGQSGPIPKRYRMERQAGTGRGWLHLDPFQCHAQFGSHFQDSASCAQKTG